MTRKEPDGTRIETRTLVLRKARDTDLETIWKNVWSDEKLAEKMLWQPTRTLEEARERMLRTKQYQSVYDAFFVCLKENDEPIGFAGIREDSPGEFEETGICICAREQGKGFGREVLEALIDLAFETHKGQVFYYSCFRGNAPSEALCRSCGFVYKDSDVRRRAYDGYEYLCDRYVLTRSRRREK